MNKALEKEIEAKSVLEQHGFKNVSRPQNNIGDWVATRDGKNYVIEVKTMFSKTKTTFRKGVRVGLHRLFRQQNKMLTSDSIALYLVYFDKIKRWIFASGYSSKIKPTDKSLFCGKR